MVIGNGFFSENREAALAEMTERSKCEVKHLPYPTVGNIMYYISYVGDLYGQQMIQGRPLTRQGHHLKYSNGSVYNTFDDIWEDLVRGGYANRYYDHGTEILPLYGLRRDHSRHDCFDPGGTHPGVDLHRRRAAELRVPRLEILPLQDLRRDHSRNRRFDPHNAAHAGSIRDCDLPDPHPLGLERTKMYAMRLGPRGDPGRDPARPELPLRLTRKRARRLGNILKTKQRRRKNAIQPNQ